MRACSQLLPLLLLGLALGCARSGFDQPDSAQQVAAPLGPVVIELGPPPSAPTRTADAQVTFVLSFSAAVTGVSVAALAPVESAGLSGCAIEAVSGEGASYQVQVSTGQGDGSLGVAVVNPSGIVDQDGVPLQLQRGGVISADTFHIDRLPPEVLSLRALTPPDLMPQELEFELRFTEPVQGFDPGDLRVDPVWMGGNEAIEGAAVLAVTGSGDSYVVTVDRGQGCGGLSIELMDDDSVLDLLGTPLGGVGQGTAARAASPPYRYSAFGERRYLSRSPVNGPTNLQTADLDGDGGLDLLAVSSDGRVSALWQQAAFSYQPQQLYDYPLPAAAGAQATDLDGDGDLDVLVASSAPGGRSLWLERTGDRAFEPRSLPGAATSTWIHTADLDGDGDADVLEAERHQLRWLRNLSQGRFATEVLLDGVTGFVCRAADLDGDGAAEVIVRTRDALSTQSFGPASVSEKVNASVDGVSSLAVADLDADGDLDLAALVQLDGELLVELYYREASGALTRIELSPLLTSPSLLVVADLVASSGVDLAVGGYDGVTLLRNEGGRAFSVVPALWDGEALSLQAGDLDGDGRSELLIGERLGGLLAMELGAASPTPRHLVPLEPVITAVTAVDLDGDGTREVVGLGEGVYAWLDVAGGEAPVLLDALVVDGEGRGADLDQDGDQDLLLRVEDEPVWLENIGALSFTAHALSAGALGSEAPWAVAISDDALPDLLLRDNYSGNILWFEAASAGSFGAVQRLGSVSRTSNIEPALVDGDARVDVFTCRWSGSPSWMWLRNDGGGAFTTQAMSSVTAPNCSAMHAADLDGDGDTDLANGGWAGGGNLLAWQENQGDGLSFIEHPLPMTHGISQLQSGDLDLDGDLDLISTTNGLGVSLHINDGQGGFDPVDACGIDTYGVFKRSTLVDLDGDGDLDLVTADFMQRTVFWLPNLAR